MASVTFKTLKKDAKIFNELKNNKLDWWNYCKKEKSFYIEVRKDNQVNVYFEGGSVIRIHYCSRKKELQTFTHHKYLGIEDDTKTYVNCADRIDGQIGSIVERIKKIYSQKKGSDKETWSEKYIQGQLIINNKDIHLDSEFAYIDGDWDIRIDLVKCVEGKIVFLELKRLDDNRMLKKTDMNPEIITQMKVYSSFINKYKEELLSYYQRLYDIKKNLELPVPSVRPQTVSDKPELLIFNRWTHMDKGGKRQKHLDRMEDILKREKVTYSIISEI